MKSQTKAYAFALGTVLLWSTVATAFKLSLRHVDIWQLLAIASITASVCLLLILLAQGKWPALSQIPRANYPRYLLLGLLNPLAYYLVLFKAYALLPAQIAQALNYTWAITMMLLSIPVLNHRVTKTDMLATAICYGGVLVICLSGKQFPGGRLDPAGITLALGSTLIWASYWLYKTRDQTDAVISLFLSFAFALPFVVGGCLVFSSLSAIPVAGLLAGIYVGLFEMGVTFVLWLLALKHTRATARVSTLIFLSPFLSLMLIHNVLNEPVPVTTLAALVLIVSGLLIQARFSNTPE